MDLLNKLETSILTKINGFVKLSRDIHIKQNEWIC